MIERIIELLKPDVSTEAKLTALVLLLGKKINSQQDEIVSLQQRQLQKGDKGEKGDEGPRGIKGERGDDGRNGVDGKNGLDGKDGKNGKNGKDGKDGIYVVDSDIDIDGHLVFRMSDGSEIDAGVLPEVDGKMGSISVSGGSSPIIISSVAPQSPLLNDLWLDIS